MDDGDISYRQTEALFAAAGRKEVDGKVDGLEGKVKELALGRHENGVVSAEILEFGGHNRVVAYVPVGLAVMRAFEEGAKGL